MANEPARKEFSQIEWDDAVQDDCRQIIRLAVREDLDRQQDWTTLALVPSGKTGAANVVSREQGVVAGLPAAALVVEEMNLSAQWTAHAADGEIVSPGQVLATVSGSLRDLLTAERILLNFLGRLSGVATGTRAFVDAIAGRRARIFDTRKTTPGWRRLEKYAVRRGGGWNHRTGLYDAILIKDNHLASFLEDASQDTSTLAAAVEAARRMAKDVRITRNAAAGGGEMIVEIEVDTLAQLKEVLPALPDIVLLDNMTPAEMAQAVKQRDAVAGSVALEASGAIRLENVADVADSGVDRISIGALTHSVRCFDIGLDWAG